jgi:hypothetical protein
MSIVAKTFTRVGTITHPETIPTELVPDAESTIAFVDIGTPPVNILMTDWAVALSMDAPKANSEDMTACWDDP